MRNKTRFRMVEQQDPARFAAMAEQSQDEIRAHWELLQRVAAKPDTHAPVRS